MQINYLVLTYLLLKLFFKNRDKINELIFLLLYALADRVTTAALNFLAYFVFIFISYFNCVLMSSIQGTFLRHSVGHVSSTDEIF
jgi:hypothetical protein